MMFSLALTLFFSQILNINSPLKNKSRLCNFFSIFLHITHTTFIECKIKLFKGVSILLNDFEKNRNYGNHLF